MQKITFWKTSTNAFWRCRKAMPIPWIAQPELYEDDLHGFATLSAPKWTTTSQEFTPKEYWKPLKY